MANLDNLAPILRKYGLNVVETAGWINRGYAGQDLAAINGVLWHHTATNRNAFYYSDAPTLGLCINGRSDLPGPLCNIVFGRNGTVYLVATGVANHAGTGAAPGFPRNMGNHYLIGIEMESSGVAPWDWTPEQLRLAPLLGAVLELTYLQGIPENMRLQMAHYEYSDAGKPDPAGWPGTMDGLRASINAKIASLKGGAPAPVKPTPAPAKPAPAKPAPKPSGYVPDPHWEVDPGDTLGEIAHYYGVTVSAIAKFNGIANPNAIKVGEWIWPPNGYTVWNVDPGDTLSKIVAWAKSVGYNTLTVDKLCNANGINNPNVMPPIGRRMLVP